MTFPSFVVMLVTALVATVPVVVLIPRQRRSTSFDRLLWAATLLVAFLGAWLGVGYAGGIGSTGQFAVAETPLLPALLGALAGALITNIPLWLLDRFEGRGELRGDDWEEEWQDETASEEDESGPAEPVSGLGNGRGEEKAAPELPDA